MTLKEKETFWRSKELLKSEFRIIMARESEPFMEIDPAIQQDEFHKCCFLIGASAITASELLFIRKMVIEDFFPWLRQGDLFLAFQLNEFSEKPIESYKQLTGGLVFRILKKYHGIAQEAWETRRLILDKSFAHFKDGEINWHVKKGPPELYGTGENLPTKDDLDEEKLKDWTNSKDELK